MREALGQLPSGEAANKLQLGLPFEDLFVSRYFGRTSCHLMKTTKSILVISLLALAGQLSPVFAAKAKVVAAPGVSMANYKTYQWLPPRVLDKDGINEHHPANGLIKVVLGQQLTQVGLKEAGEDADLAVQVYVTTASVPQLEAVLLGEGYNFDYGTVVASMGRYNREGSLYINLIDRKTKKSVWAGMMTDNLKRGTLTAEEITEKLEKTAAGIFKQYPTKK